MIPPAIENRIKAFNPGFSPLVFKAVLIGIFFVCLSVPLVILALPYTDLLNDMAVQYKGKAQSEYGLQFGEELRVERKPVAGTFHTAQFSYPFEGTDEATAVAAGKALVNPLPRSLANMELGRKLYDRYCATCHGMTGMGDGKIVGPDLFPAPPSLHTDTARAFPDGRIFHVITKGQSPMPSYADKLETDERWAVVHYLRALQRSQNPEPEDLNR